MDDHWQPVLARELQLSVKEVCLLVGVEPRHEEVEPDLTHRDQPRVVPPGREFGIELRQVLVPRLARAHGMDAERVASSCACASSRTLAKLATSTAGITHRATLRCAARARTTGISPPNSGASRWQWVSTKTAIGG